MKITKTYLRQVIKEELSAVLQEGYTLETSPYDEKIDVGLKHWERVAGLHKPDKIQKMRALHRQKDYWEPDYYPIAKDIYKKLKLEVATQAGAFEDARARDGDARAAAHLKPAMDGALESIYNIMASAVRHEQLGLYKKEDYQKFVDEAEKEMDRVWRSDAQQAGDNDPYRVAAQIRWGFADLLKRAYEYKKDASTTGDPMGSIKSAEWRYRTPTEKEKPGMFAKLKGLVGLEEDLDL
jgi:hypothetical protein